MGYLVPEGELAVPVSLVGHPLAPATDAASAGRLLDAEGLRALNRRFWADWPGEGWTAVLIIETSPAEVRFRREWGEPAQLRETITVPNPVGDLLRHDPP